MVESGVGVTGVDDSFTKSLQAEQQGGRARGHGEMPVPVMQTRGRGQRGGVRGRGGSAGVKPGKKAGCELPEVDINTHDA